MTTENHGPSKGKGLTAADLATFLGLFLGFGLGMSLLGGTFGLENWAWGAIGAMAGAIIGWIIGKVAFAGRR